MSIAKNKGPLMTSNYRGDVDVIPKEFLASVGLDILWQHVPIDVDPDPIMGLLLESKVEQERTDERKKTNTSWTGDPTPLISEEMTDKKQLATRTRSLVTVGTDLPTLTDLTTEASQHNLGDGWLDQNVVTVPNLFQALSHGRERGIVTPQDFLASLQQHQEDQTVAGTAPTPTLATGDISIINDQTDEFVYRQSHRFIDTSVLPREIDNKKTNQYKQIVAVRRYLELDTHTPAVPTATIDVEFTKLGDGTALEVQEEVPEVFPQFRWTKIIPDVVPEDFKALLILSTQEATTDTPFAEPPDPGSGVYETESVQDTDFTSRNRSTSRDLSGLPLQNVNHETNQFKQDVTITRILEADTTTPASATALLDVEFTKLGDGTALEVHRAVSEVFQKNLYMVDRAQFFPFEYRALKGMVPEQTTGQTTAGNASPISLPLATGVLQIEDEDETLYTHRVTTKAVDITQLPVSQVDYRTNRYKQVETVTKTWSLDTATPATPTALKDTTFILIGDGTAVQEKVEIDEVFNDKAVSTEIPDTLPEIFKAVFPVHIHDFVQAGTTVADPPTLDTGDFLRTEKRETEFTIRVTTRGRNGISFPRSLVASRQIGGMHFGGEVTQLTGYLDDSEPLVETGLDIVSSEVKNLGNGTWFRQTEKLDTAIAWPTLVGLTFDREMQVQNQFERQVVDSSYSVAPPSAGDFFVETVEPLDQYHSRREKKYAAPSASDSTSALLSEVWEPYKFPGLVGASVFPTTVFAATFYRRATAQLCKHTVRTWWVNSATKPTSGPPGSSSDVEVEEIITGMAYTADPNNLSLIDRVSDVLNDAQVFAFSGVTNPATTPSFTEYYLGTPSGSSISIFASLYAYGAGYTIGDTLSVSGGGVTADVTVDSVGVSNSIVGSHTTSGTGSTPGLYGPYPASGGSGTDAMFYIEVIDVPTYTPGTAWIGTERVIEASITPTDIPFLWKVQTKAVVMR